MGKIRELEKQIEIAEIACGVWPEKAEAYRDDIARMKGEIGRLKRARKRAIAKSFNRPYAHSRGELDREYRRLMERDK